MKGRVSVKKLICIVFVVLSLCGCSEKRSSVKPVLKGISFNAEITCYNECYTAACAVSEDGAISAEVTSPDELKGLKFAVKNGDITTEFDGISATEKLKDLPVCGAYTAMIDVLCDVMNSEDPVINDGNELFINAGTENGKYRLSIAPTGLPLSLEIPDQGFKMEFFDAQLNTAH